MRTTAPIAYCASDDEYLYDLPELQTHKENRCRLARINPSFDRAWQELRRAEPVPSREGTAWIGMIGVVFAVAFFGMGLFFYAIIDGALSLRLFDVLAAFR